MGRDKNKVAVALSGGVDSSLTALMLREKGHQVVGLSMKLGQGPDLAWQAGAQVAAELKIPHVVVDVAAEFERWVARPAIEAYASGRTPNPCARCNARVKFPLLWRAAREAGCSQLATGHYARLVKGPNGPRLEEGIDPAKSQAYFLARLRPDQLAPLLFPLGELTKAQVREEAARQGLSAAQSSESQDACFLPAGGWEEIVSRAGAVRPGSLVDEQGRELGRHGGLHRFTVGQRRGLGVALGSPHYVLALDGPKAQVMVGPAESLLAVGLKGVSPVWHEPVTARMDLTVRLRYTHRGAACRVVSQDCSPGEEPAGGAACRVVSQDCSPGEEPAGGVARRVVSRECGSAEEIKSKAACRVVEQSRWKNQIEQRGAAKASKGGTAGSGHLSQAGETEITVDFETPQKAVAPGQLAVFYREARVVGSAWITQSIKHTDGMYNETIY